MAVGRILTVGGASQILHWIERSAEVVTAGGALTSSWVAVGGSAKLLDVS